MTGILEDLYEHAPCGYLTTSPDGLVTKANATFLEWTGFSLVDLVGHSFDRLLSPGSQIFYETRYLPILRLSGSVHEVALTLRCADGRSLPVLINATTKFEDDGTPLFVRTALFDATERHDLERQLVSARRVAEASEARVRVLQDASVAFSPCTTAEALAHALAESARTAFRAAGAAVMLTDEAGTLNVVAGTDLLDQVMPAFAPRPWIHTARSGSMVTISSLTEAAQLYPGLEETLRAVRLEAISLVPLQAGPLILGVLICFYGRKRAFDGPSRELHEALARQATQVLERVRLQDELRQLALYDQLTGLANRKLLNYTLEIALASAERRGSTMGLIFFDLDGFKAVNDHLGHVAGDTVLREIAQRLRTTVRAVDTIARFGGDEFVVVCETVDQDAALGLAQRIRSAVSRPLAEAASPYPVTASVGLVVYQPTEGAKLTATELLRLADSAMYESKRTGKDRVTTVEV
ncbi:hypothetical protein GY21_03735 [Cryobacterium roopkundense]|uniref:Serine/threonine-protein kinase RsbW n=1 Tax=Cryobacterium roopkundense TaxID=1001240 RepID=A0A099JQR6_9MICO|nr:diguanylate cyclase [Cryobacterium roopkundense]KGJ79778.1 hypothetical protein GY21_03735 [Cryobacterium roopkundense]MBB5640267.1 serine/threonine-protein kinase RsbW [Cryobacterium roopkundense]